MSRDQGKRWQFTFYKVEDLDKLREFEHDALVCAWEEGTKEQHRHIQGYIRFKSNRRWSWWKKTFHSNEEKSAHWELAKGSEIQNHTYIADVARYLRESPNAHEKLQGEIIYDYGCDTELDVDVQPDIRIVQGLSNGAKLSTCFKSSPMYFYHNSAKINALYHLIRSWRHDNEDYMPSEFQPYKRARYIRQASSIPSESLPKFSSDESKNEEPSTPLFDTSGCEEL